MYARAILNTSDVSSTDTVAWHVGISPPFPPSLLLSNDATVERLVTDIPFLSVGLLGFGILTFLLAMHKFNRIVGAAFSSVILAFVAGIFDVSQVLFYNDATTSNNRLSKVLPVLIAQEILLALSLGFRFLFFWGAVSLRPRGEPPVFSQQIQNDLPSFLKFDNESHSGGWSRWGLAGITLKYALLLAVVSISALQLLWRLVAKFSTPGSIYKADGILELVVSALFILKLLGNVWLSPVTPKWKIIRDYLPLISSLLIGMGVPIGNILQFQFSETALGRFLQAVELYIVVLYILIFSFYEPRSPLRVLAKTQDNENVDGAGDKMYDISAPHSASFGVNLPDSSRALQMSGQRAGNSHLASSNETSATPSNIAQPWKSTGRRLSSWPLSGKPTERRDVRRSAPWIKKDTEKGNSPLGQKTGFAISTEMAASTSKSPGWEDRAFTTGKLRTSARKVEIPATNGSTLLSSRASLQTAEGLDLPLIPTVHDLDTSLHGDDVISLRYNLRLSRADSQRFAGQRRQAYTEKSTAELQSPSGVLPVSDDAPIDSKTEASFGSDFTLSKFPWPPEISTSQMGDDLRVFQSGDRGTFETNSERSRYSFASAVGPTSVIGTSIRTESDATSTVLQYDVTSSLIGLTRDVILKENLNTIPQTTDGENPNGGISSTAAAPPLLSPAEGLAMGTRSLFPRGRMQDFPNQAKPNIRNTIPTKTRGEDFTYERPRPAPPRPSGR